MTSPRGVDAVLADALRDSGLTQRAIGFRLGLSAQAVSDRMRGRTSWTTREVPVVCQLLNLDVAHVYDEGLHR